MHENGINIAIDGELIAKIAKAVGQELLHQFHDVGAKLPDRLAIGEAEAARLLSLRQHQLRDSRLRGEIAHSKGPGGRILYQRKDIIDYLMTRRVTAQD